ncbi:MAG TPA: hypothetical protein VNL71_20215 [Chloroflexota bacterium]|nr:hypothetical protein [Chloroflexota bacterium]
MSNRERSNRASRLVAIALLTLLTTVRVTWGGVAAHAAARPSVPLVTATVTPQPSQPARAYPTVGQARPSAKSYTLRYTGTAVNFDLSGLEPDFDPIYKVIVSTTLHDTRSKSVALPDATLILSAYLEVFQPDTTPVLPDLLHPNQVASNLAGFLSGAAALINVGGKVIYRGSMVGEIFQDSTEGLVIDLAPIGAASGDPSVRLQGVLVLHKGGSESGTLQALTPLPRSALEAPRDRMPSWQAVVNGMSVHTPTMMGTAGAPGKKAPAQPATLAPLAPAAPVAAVCDTACRLRRPIVLAPIVVGILILLLGLLTGWRRARGLPRT